MEDTLKEILKTLHEINYKLSLSSFRPIPSDCAINYASVCPICNEIKYNLEPHRCNITLSTLTVTCTTCGQQKAFDAQCLHIKV